MKKLLGIAAASLFVVSIASCDSKLKESEAENAALQGDVKELVATQDSLLMLVNDITEGMNQIKDLEKIISTPGALDGETPSRKEQIKNDIVAIQNALEERRQKLEEMEQKLQSTYGENSTLRKTIASLKTQIAEQQTQITELTNQLAAAHIEIKELTGTVSSLNDRVSSLNDSVATESRERQVAQAQATSAANELNTCYYAIGTDKELKKNGILEKKFLGKTKVMQGDYNAGYFTRADKRTLTTINTHSPKAEIMTNMPKDSYTITKVGNDQVITITDAARFWSLSNFLVIKVK